MFFKQSGVVIHLMTSNRAQSEAPQPGLRRAALYCNAKSRRGREWYPAVLHKLTEEGFELVETNNFSDPSQMRPKVELALREGIPLIVVGGGDGTMSAVAAAFKGSNSTMGVLPLGTGNAFARDLGIPPDIDGACKVLIEGMPRFIDLGIAGGKHFVNVATVGLTTRIAEELDDRAKRLLGRWVYALAIARAVATLKPFRATLTKPDGVETFDTMQIVFGSGRFHAGPFPVTPDAEITDRMLHGYALKGTNKATLLKYAFSLWGGRHVKMVEVEQFSLKSALLETTPRKHVVIDGEIGQRTPIEVSIDPGAVRVMVARDFPGEGHSPRSDTTGEVLIDAPVHRSP
jgi:diacylglycerol kinase (ATP)